MRRVLRILIPLVAALAGASALAVHAVYRGWHLDALTPAQLSSLLRLQDETLVPTGDGPFPALLLFHGCGGKSDSLRAWARLARDLGWVAVMVDSLRGRGLDAARVCSGRALWGGERAGDVLVSLRDVRLLPFVDPDRIVLAGWSHGAWAVMDLLAIDAAGQLPPGLSTPSRDARLDGLAGVVLFYPYCGLIARSAWNTWRVGVPALMLLAGADSLAPAGDCVDVAHALEQDGQRIATLVYPGARHGFDALGSEAAHDPAAAADARRRVAAFLTSLR